MLLILFECAAEEISRSFRCDSGQIRRWVVWTVILVISESVILQPQVLIDSKVMFLKFWMIFAKSLSLVYDEFFHKRNKFLLASPKEWISKILIRTPKRVFLIICFWHQTVCFQSSRREFSLSFSSLAIGCTFASLIFPSLHFTVIYTKRVPNPFNFANFEFVAMQNKKVTKVLGKHKKLILCDHEKNSARSKKEAEKFSLSLAARKIVIFYPCSLPSELIENIIPPTEPKFSRIFSAILLLLSKCNALRIPFFFISSTFPVIRLDLLFIFYFVANFYTFCMIQWKIKIKNF